MSTQADVDALFVTVEGVADSIVAVRKQLQAEIDALSTGAAAIDVSNLAAAIAPLDALVNALGTIRPDPIEGSHPADPDPAPAPDPDPVPDPTPIDPPPVVPDPVDPDPAPFDPPPVTVDPSGPAAAAGSTDAATL